MSMNGLSVCFIVSLVAIVTPGFAGVMPGLAGEAVHAPRQLVEPAKARRVAAEALAFVHRQTAGIRALPGDRMVDESASRHHYVVRDAEVPRDSHHAGDQATAADRGAAGHARATRDRRMRAD